MTTTLLRPSHFGGSQAKGHYNCGGWCVNEGDAIAYAVQTTSFSLRVASSLKGWTLNFRPQTTLVACSYSAFAGVSVVSSARSTFSDNRSSLFSNAEILSNRCSSFDAAASAKS